MQEVGFNLFTEMLNRAVAHLKQGKAIDTVDLTQPLGISTEINLRTPAPAARRLLSRTFMSA